MLFDRLEERAGELINGIESVFYAIHHLSDFALILNHHIHPFAIRCSDDHGAAEGKYDGCIIRNSCQGT